MFVIYKYPLQMTGRQFIELPLGAQVLCVQIQHENPYLWAVVDPAEKDTESREFVIEGTGVQFNPLGTYINTFQQLGGDGIWHVFEVTD